MAGEAHGRLAQLKVQNAAGVLVTVANGSSAGLDESVDTAEITAFDDAAKRYLAGLADGTVSFEGTWSEATFKVLREIKQLTRTFEFYPAGNAATNEKLSGSVILTALNRSSSVGDAVKGSVSFQITGGVVAATI